MENETGFLQFDGHRVGYATVGEGPVLVLPAWWVSHATEDWRSESFRRFLESLAARYRVVRYDRIGTGLSDREREQLHGLLGRLKSTLRTADEREVDGGNINKDAPT